MKYLIGIVTILAVTILIVLGARAVSTSSIWASNMVQPISTSTVGLTVTDSSYDGQRLQPAANIAELYLHE